MSEITEYKMRPINLKKDFDELIPFYDQIFEKELMAKGASVEAMLKEMKSLMPIFKFIGIFSKNFRHVFDGFVFENKEGKIVSTVNIGFSGNFWEIAMVATHPNHRRKGLAKKLIDKSIEHAQEHKATMCILEVLEENEPAYNLYVNKGFVHYDTSIKLKLDKDIKLEITNQDFPEGYIIEKRKQDNATGKALYDLEYRATPESVLSFHPINEIKYKKSFLMRMIRPFVKLFIRSKADRFVIKHNDKIVGNIYVGAGHTENDFHKLDIILDPDHSEKLTKPTISFALNYYQKNSKYDLNTVTIIRKTDSAILLGLQEFGFSIYETDHLLGLKLRMQD